MNYPWLTDLNNRLQYQSQTPPQGVCLIGAPGLGQELLASQFAQSLLSTQDLPNHPDFLLFTPEEGKSIGIDKIREITEFCLLAPTRASRKVVMIQPVDAMTAPAQQAFLKTLEEPVVPTTFILLCYQAHQLLPTLRSRCQVLALPSVSFHQAQPWLASQGKTISPEMYALSDGAPLLLLEPAFEHRQLAYQSIEPLLKKKALSNDAHKSLSKAEPNDVLTGFYYALMHARQFELLDKCMELRKKYADNANLNWDMQLNAFLLEVQAHVV